MAVALAVAVADSLRSASEGFRAFIRASRSLRRPKSRPSEAQMAWEGLIVPYRGFAGHHREKDG